MRSLRCGNTKKDQHHRSGTRVRKVTGNAFATMVAPLRASAQRLGVRAAAAAATITTATITTATACAASAEPFGNARQFEAIKRFRSQLVRMPEMTTRFS